MVGNAFIRALWVGALLSQPAAAAIAVDDSVAATATSISKAVFAGGSLWLLTDTGHLSSVSPNDHRQVDAPIPGAIFDLWVQDGEPAALSRHDPRAASWSIWHRIHDKWSSATIILPQKDEHYVGAGSSAGSLAVLTTRRLINIRGRQQESLPVAWEPERLPALATMLVTDSAVYVGYNAGEWGGWIRAVDRSTGKVTPVAAEFGDPVTGLALEPNGCVALSMGLIHMGFQSGGVGEFCGERARRVYTKTVRDQETEPFFGIAAAGGQLWAIGADGLYRIAPDGAVQTVPMPAFSQMGNVTVSFDLPQFALVLTGVNRHLAVSGATPLFAPR